MPIGPGRDGFTWDYGSVVTNAPAQFGVYAIYNQRAWIYFGEGENIRARLLAHLNGDNHCILQNQPTGFSFELVSASLRVARQDALIAQLGSLCNQRLG
jgi:hypothetical protein